MFTRLFHALRGAFTFDRQRGLGRGLSCLAAACFLAFACVLGTGAARANLAPPQHLRTGERLPQPATAGPALDVVPPVPQLVNQGSRYPLSAIVHIEAQFADGTMTMGSGTMIDRFHVLTAGHVIFNARHGGTGFPTKVWVWAGQMGDAGPFGTAYGTYFRTFDSFMADDRASADGTHNAGDGDIGLITLDRTLGDRTGWFGYGPNNDDNFFKNRLMNTAGYPAESGYSGRDMYEQNGRIIGAIPGTRATFGALKWSTSVITSIPGQSGSGIYDYDPATNNRVVYAVLDLHDDAAGFGYAERITQPVFTALQQWIAQDRVPQTAA